MEDLYSIICYNLSSSQGLLDSKFLVDLQYFAHSLQATLACIPYKGTFSNYWDYFVGQKKLKGNKFIEQCASEIVGLIEQNLQSITRIKPLGFKRGDGSQNLLYDFISNVNTELGSGSAQASNDAQVVRTASGKQLTGIFYTIVNYGNEVMLTETQSLIKLSQYDETQAKGQKVFHDIVVKDLEIEKKEKEYDQFVHICADKDDNIRLIREETNGENGFVDKFHQSWRAIYYNSANCAQSMKELVNALFGLLYYENGFQVNNKVSTCMMPDKLKGEEVRDIIYNSLLNNDIRGLNIDYEECETPQWITDIEDKITNPKRVVTLAEDRFNNYCGSPVDYIFCNKVKLADIEYAIDFLSTLQKVQK